MTDEAAKIKLEGVGYLEKWEGEPPADMDPTPKIPLQVLKISLDPSVPVEEIYRRSDFEG